MNFYRHSRLYHTLILILAIFIALVYYIFNANAAGDYSASTTFSGAYLGQLDSTNSNTPSWTQGVANSGRGIIGAIDDFGYNRPTSVAYDTVHNRTFVLDGNNKRVMVYETGALSINTYPTATDVLGQNDFYTNNGIDGRYNFLNPVSIAYDDVRERLFVADFPPIGAISIAPRVLVFDVRYGPNLSAIEACDFGTSGITTQGLRSGAPASCVIGQPDYTTLAGTVSSNSITGVSTIVYDKKNDRLFVSDTGAKRILIFNTAPSVTSLLAGGDGENASNVLCIPNFTDNYNTYSSFPSYCQSSFESISYDPARELLYFFSPDPNVSTTLYFLRSFNVDPSLNASMNGIAAVSRFSLSEPVTTRHHLAYSDISKSLFISSEDTHRIYYYDLTTLSNSLTASAVLGANLNSAVSTLSDASPSERNLNHPLGITLSPSGSRLLVADSGWNRVIEYNFISLNTSSLSSGATCSYYKDSNGNPVTLSSSGSQGSVPYFMSNNPRWLLVTAGTSGTGILSGKPSSGAENSSPYQIVITAQDQGSWGTFHSSKSYTLNISKGCSSTTTGTVVVTNPPPPPPSPTIKITAPEDAVCPAKTYAVGDKYREKIKVENAIGPVTFIFDRTNPVPSDLQLVRDGQDEYISGTLNDVGDYYDITVIATDRNGTQSIDSFNLSIFAKGDSCTFIPPSDLVFNNPNLCLDKNSHLATQLTTTPSGASFALNGGDSLPSGLTLSNGFLSGSISPGDYNDFTIVATKDSNQVSRKFNSIDYCSDIPLEDLVDKDILDNDIVEDADGDNSYIFGLDQKNSCPIAGLLRNNSFLHTLTIKMCSISPSALILTSIIGFLFGLLPLLYTLPFSVGHFGTLLFTLLAKKVRPWGVVYDAVTKQPLDPAHVELVNKEGEVVASAITDIDGRYGFLVPAGSYMIRPKKSNYVFPSVILGHVTRDEIYSDLYFGNYFELKKDEIITKNIPMDPSKFDWNEYEKEQQKLQHYFSRKTVLYIRIANSLFAFGFLSSFVAFIARPILYNAIIFLLYIVLLVVRESLVSFSKLGLVVDKKSGKAVPFAIIRVYSAKLGNEVIHKIATSRGQFYLLIPNGLYVVSIEKKNVDGTYTKIFTSEIIEVKKGIIKGVWEV